VSYKHVERALGFVAHEATGIVAIIEGQVALSFILALSGAVWIFGPSILDGLTTDEKPERRSKKK
jgi:hypothetical protein